MKNSFVCAPYSERRADFVELEFARPNYRKAFRHSQYSHRFPMNPDVVLDSLGLDGEGIFSTWFARDPTVGTLPLPLKPSNSNNGSPETRLHEAEIVRSFGRGYVLNMFASLADGSTVRGGLATKGGGVNGWVADNLSWFIHEHGSRGVVPGAVTEIDLVRDITGEYLASKAMLYSPRTVYIAKINIGYQIARLWDCPYRIWEITSGPWRKGPLVSECFFILNWGVELIYALNFRETILRQASSRLFDLHSPNRGVAEIIYSTERLLLKNVARSAAPSIQLWPFAFHLANVSYSGATSGFDRIMRSAEHPTPRRLGILCALFDSWAASSWLRAATCQRTLSFHEYFEKFQDALISVHSGQELDSFFLRSGNMDSIFKTEASVLLPHPLRQLPFSVRQEGDIERFVRSAELFFSGLSLILNGEIKNKRELLHWVESVDFFKIEAQRVFQWFSGDVSGDRRTAYRQKLRQHSQLFRSYIHEH